MGDVVLFPQRPGTNLRADEAAMLRQVVMSKKFKFRAGDQERVAARVDAFIERYGEVHGHGSLSPLCARIWACDDGNPTRRRAEIKTAKKPVTLLNLIERIAKATGGLVDDMQLEAFRGTRHAAEVDARRRGTGAEPELDQFWAVLSDTLHHLATSVSRVAGLEAHLERMVALHGTYDLAADEVRSSPGRLLGQPLANWNEHWSEFPPVPSVVLFAESKSASVERNLELHGPEQLLAVQVTVMREVRLAIGPVDNLLVPGPLFEFRSVLQLSTGGQALHVRRPWVYLETEEDLEVEIDGAWRAATLPLADGDPARMPEGYDPEPSLRECGVWVFPAKLEAPLQYGHEYIVWRPVTPDTCRELLLRPIDVALGPFDAQPRRHSSDAQVVDTFCPSGTLGEAIEAALHAEGPNSLAGSLRAEAERMVTLLRAWHAKQAGAAEAAHRNLRTKWENWS